MNGIERRNELEKYLHTLHEGAPRRGLKHAATEALNIKKTGERKIVPEMCFLWMREGGKANKTMRRGRSAKDGCILQEYTNGEMNRAARKALRVAEVSMRALLGILQSQLSSVLSSLAHGCTQNCDVTEDDPQEH